MSTALVILAAGLGARYGGAKQFEPVGPDGATLMDYTVFDALRAGVERVVFVVRPELLDASQRLFDPRYADRVEVRYSIQSLDDRPTARRAPVDRRKPWGTGHAVLAAERAAGGPFVVANADDFYGPTSLARAVRFLHAARNEPSASRHAGAGRAPTATAPPGRHDHALVAFRLRDTLSSAARVSRAVCTVGGDGILSAITERTGIEPAGADATADGLVAGRERLAGDALVSMNLWAFQPPIFDSLRAAFASFLDERGDDPRAEFFLPAAVQSAIASGAARVHVLPTTDRWCGLTAAADRPIVERVLREHVTRGDYPAPLWPSPAE
ncbi:MAG: NDP-sugar synthase [Phycisphaerae bacterium]